MTSHSVPASDPNALLLAARYPLHARREFIVLSARAVQLGVVLGYDLLRVEGPEGAWACRTDALGVRHGTEDDVSVLCGIAGSRARLLRYR